MHFGSAPKAMMMSFAALLSPAAQAAQADCPSSRAQVPGQAQYRVAEIFLSATPGTAARVRPRAEAIVRRLAEGTDFWAVAQQHSESPSVRCGGDRGWVGLGELVPEVAAVIGRMVPGQIGGPIAARDGYWVVMLMDRR